MKHMHHPKHHGTRFSIILIVVGLVFLAVNTGLLPTIYQPLFASWPIWLVFGGIYFLLDCSWFMGLSLLTVGTFYIIPQIGHANPALNIPENFAHLYWPALLVVAGIYFILSKTFGKHCWMGGNFHQRFEKFNTTTMNSEDGFLNVNASFDSRKNIVIDPIFKGGNIDCSFGEVVLDLRKTTLQEGKTILNINCKFGTVIILVPSDWNVQLQGDSAFGAFDDSRYSPTYNSNSSSSLLIQGKCSFGEVKLRD
ncbi:MAG TPA: LiaF domain-containing protein [Bacteroidales bacterium]|nr:LiaF domain-containing protein [Bacteroidales bacterium]